eukprot:scaffold1581_cov169-Amphora_coffeaeformis.AAC.46
MHHLFHFLIAIILISRQGVVAFVFRNFKKSAPQPWQLFDSTYDVPEDDDSPTSSPRGRRGRVRPLRREGQLSSRAQSIQEQTREALKRQEIAQQDPNLLVDAQFSEVVSPPTDRALKERMGVDRMTLVQGNTFAFVRNGESLVARARTGTGKSLAFLVPSIERLLAMDATQFQPGKQIGLLVVVPTRELAMQIAETAKDLVAFHPLLLVKAVYGGTSMKRDVRALEERMPTILVATPGRLLDLIRDERIKGRKFADILKETSSVVLDEADLLMMGGFGKDVLKILSHLPRKRQTMLFSATIPKRLKTILPEVCMTSEWKHIDCVDEDSDNQSRVEEIHFGLERIDMYVPTLLSLVRELQDGKNEDPESGNKIMIFFPAVRIVRFFAEVIRETMNDFPVWEIHSQLSQSARRRVADSFRSTSHGILLTSDVSARGMDYPDVDIVVQYGLPNKRELYLHRIGRTGRAGRTGQAILVSMPFESPNSMGRRTWRKDYADFNANRTNASLLLLESREMRFIRQKIRDKRQPLGNSAEGFVLAFLAYYAANKTQKMKPEEIRTAGERLSSSIGLETLPQLSESLEDELK